jgi:hypothetical protein
MRADLMAGKALKEAGLAKIEARHAYVLGALRELARNLAWERGEISINDLREESHNLEDIPPLCFSAVFRGKEWEACGFTLASHPQAHGRTVRVYRLRRDTW